MKRLSYRSWVLMLGIAVAMMIVTAAILFNGSPASSFSMTSGVQTPSTLTTATVAIKKVLEKFDIKLFQSR